MSKKLTSVSNKEKLKFLLRLESRIQGGLNTINKPDISILSMMEEANMLNTYFLQQSTKLNNGEYK